jgi:hypothetical protein
MSSDPAAIDPRTFCGTGACYKPSMKEKYGFQQKKALNFSSGLSRSN